MRQKNSKHNSFAILKNNITHRKTCDKLKFIFAQWTVVCDCSPFVNALKTKPEISQNFCYCSQVLSPSSNTMHVQMQAKMSFVHTEDINLSKHVINLYRRCQLKQESKRGSKYVCMYACTYICMHACMKDTWPCNSVLAKTLTPSPAFILVPSENQFGSGVLAKSSN